MSKRDVQFSLLLALAVAVTLGLKVSTTQYDLDFDSAALSQGIKAKLDAQGFVTHQESQGYQSAVIDAVRGTCHMRVRDGALGGQYATIFAQQAAGLGPIRYLYRGAWGDSPPLLRMQMDRATAHLMARLGFSGQFPATLAVAARGCNPATFDFAGFRSIWAPRIPLPKP